MNFHMIIHLNIQFTNGTNLEEQVRKISNIPSADTGMVDINKKKHFETRKYDWSNLYGELPKRRV